MGKYNIVAIGGTGAKCLEAIVHLCSTGLGPDELFVLVVDSDESNGNIEKLKKVITNYQECYRILAPSSSIFRTKIDFSKEKITWSPARLGESLANYFRYDTLISSYKELGDICNLLYSQPELNLKWDKGFCGRSSIGAPVMSRIEELLHEPPWSDFIQNIEQNLGSGKDSRLFVLASIFGATGASGFPVVAGILREHFKNKKDLYIGGALLLPYFSFTVPPKQKGKGVFSAPEDFLLKTKVALTHYSYIWDMEPSPYDLVYLTGEKVQDRQEGETERRFAAGGPDQNNYAHFIELLAALSSFDFYSKTIDRGSVQQLATARVKEKVIEWRDLPSDDIKTMLLFFSTLAFSYRVFYHPLLIDLNLSKKPYLASWYVDHFLDTRLSSDIEKGNLKSVYDYFQTFLEWLYEICSSTGRELQFLNRNAFTESKNKDFKDLDDKYFKTLSPTDGCECSLGYDSLWNMLCNLTSATAEGPSSPAGRFTYLLYKASGEFCMKNYSM